MIRIIHLSDFHLNNKTYRDWKKYLKSALNKKLSELNSEESIDLIVFTGDMVDKGGKDYNGATHGFQLFEQDIINPILNEIKLSKDNFLIIPGNHDIERAADGKRDELGSREFFKERENISEFISEKLNKPLDLAGMKRIESYKKFEKNFYQSCKNENHITNFGSSFILNLKGVSFGLSCLNSAWRCYDNNDSGRLLVGLDQIDEHTKFISDTTWKIALVHHPLDNLSMVERSLISSHIYKNYNMLLFGHSHSSYTAISSGFTGSVFINMAPSGLNNIYSDSREYSNGFTVIDIDINQKEICCKYWRYNLPNTNFVLNTDAGANGTGKFCGKIPDEETVKRKDNIKQILENIKEDHFEEMNNHLVGVKADIKDVTCIKDAFVMPPISSGMESSEEEDEENLTINQFMHSDWNQIFFGSSECGKTVLLYRLITEYVDEYEYVRKIPVYINIEDLGNKELITSIKEYLRCSSNEAKDLIAKEDLVLLVDNLNYKKYEIYKEQIKRFHKFLNENKRLKVIATSDGNFTEVTPMEYIQLCVIPFKINFIKNLQVRQIKGLMRLWIPEEDDLKQEVRLDKMITNFNSYALPSTAMSVSLFLWSTENNERKPINHAVLLEIYIEIILEKLQKENIYRETFSFKNKMQLLAKLANEMLVVEEDNYSLSYSDYVGVIEKYLKNLVGFDFDSDVISKYFLERKIFTKFQQNRVKFAYSCFFHFFLAKRMEFDNEFKEHVLQESEYYKFGKEIDFYSGLTLSDKSLLIEIHKRFRNEFESTDFVLGAMAGKWDKHFIIDTSKKVGGKENFEPIARRVEINQIRSNRPSDELIEDFNNRRLLKISDPSTILKKQGNISLESLLVILSNVLRNSEGVEDKELKKTIYNDLVKYSMIWMVLYREYVIDYVLKNNRLPPTIPMEIGLINILKNLPLHIEIAMNRHLGTAKLAPIILEKIKEDSLGHSPTKSDIESFLSVALYSDIQGNDFPKYFKRLIKQLGNNPVRDYSFYKLRNYYYRRTKEGSPNEEMYLDMLSELRIKSLNLPQSAKERIKKTFKNSKKKMLKGLG